MAIHDSVLPSLAPLRPLPHLPFLPPDQDDRSVSSPAPGKREGGVVARDFLDSVRDAFYGEPDQYNRILEIMKSYSEDRVDMNGVVLLVKELFKGRDDLIEGMNYFLPRGARLISPVTIVFSIEQVIAI